MPKIPGPIGSICIVKKRISSNVAEKGSLPETLQRKEAFADIASLKTQEPCLSLPLVILLSARKGNQLWPKSPLTKTRTTVVAYRFCKETSDLDPSFFNSMCGQILLGNRTNGHDGPIFIFPWQPHFPLGKACVMMINTPRCCDVTLNT